MSLVDLERLIASGESESLELKKSTAELRSGMQTLCGFLNGKGGRLLFSVKPDGSLVGQAVSDQTLRDIAGAFEGFEPPARPALERIPLEGGREVLALRVEAATDALPFTYEGRPYERVSSTTRRMPQEKYEALLFERSHSRRRWENQEAEGTALRDLDREEVFRVLDAAHTAGRLVESVGRDLGRVLDRLGVRRTGTLLRAAVVLFGKRFLPDFPQCELRMARFRGTEKDEFIDQRQIRGPAFRLLEEAMLFCQRHLPVAGRVEPGRLERVDRPLIPPDALREILVNALIHREYSEAGGAVSLAIFDDRVEIWSAGRLPPGITPEALTQEHVSRPRNPLIAEVFYRAGLIEKWGRGTNRVVAHCLAAKIPAPEFREIAGAVEVTFRVPVTGTPQVTPHVAPQVTPQVTPQVAAILRAAMEGPVARDGLMAAAGIGDRWHFLKSYLEPLLTAGWLVRTIPDKPRSPLEKYRTTEAGRIALATVRQSPEPNG